jgi:NAD(P)-dependent dehydrogenase (short-subunit alcohol dehydrogenase family)
MIKQTILITGGTGVLGNQFAKYFAKKGWQVLITSTQKDKAIKFKNSFLEGKNIEIFICDLTQPDASFKLLKEVLSKGFKINHLINNARSTSSLVIQDNGTTHRDNFISEYLMHVIVPYELSTYLIELQSEDCKTITNIGSMYGIVAVNPNLYSENDQPSPIHYGVAKAACHHLTKELAIRFSENNVRVNCVAFGGVEGRVNKDFKKRYAKLNPSNRMLLAEEVVGPIDFLIDNKSSSITGHTIVADGGWSIW